MEKDKDNCRIYNENHMENCNVFLGDQYGATFPLPGSQVTIHQTFGKNAKPTSDVKEGKVESAEDRDRRKLEVIRDIVGRFNFEPSQLGYDGKGKRITNERIAILFRKCFGFGSYPTVSNKAIMEQMWVMLIDKREKCFKEAGEGFFRQTVLNVLGHFYQSGLLCGEQNKLLQAVFPKANPNLTKNLQRGITSSFPKGTDEMIDRYIETLMDGEI